LQRGSLTVAERQRHQHPRIELIGVGRVDLAADEIDSEEFFFLKTA